MTEQKALEIARKLSQVSGPELSPLARLAGTDSDNLRRFFGFERLVWMLKKIDPEKSAPFRALGLKITAKELKFAPRSGKLIKAIIDNPEALKKISELLETDSHDLRNNLVLQQAIANRLREVNDEEVTDLARAAELPVADVATYLAHLANESNTEEESQASSSSLY